MFIYGTNRVLGLLERCRSCWQVVGLTLADLVYHSFADVHNANVW